MSAITPEGHIVLIGQRWRDLDKRMRGVVRTIESIDLNGGFVYYKTSRFCRVAIKRLRRPFFELVV